MTAQKQYGNCVAQRLESKEHDMGCYVEPESQTKEEFLAAKGRPITQEEAGDVKYFRSPELPVVLINNGGFTAAGIVFDEYEYENFSHPADYRRKQWYMVKTEDLFEVSKLRSVIA